ncbi:hypothetical protein C6990_05330 [Nitrosopumilus sp. b3]|uniref:hypothetical protein n=1 Tax=Nitrosopumilus sp. b3 TaxID=2109909 RepID=UPI0015F3E495|nr:hypothetical protein [Nitrosopumilus sp. b3]KAF6247103.1 hypothetical protein C6990_05330 [Nitrosopumilus sp. b3]
MGLVKRERNKQNYYYFKKGNDYVYLGPVSKPHEIKIDRVEDLLGYVTERFQYYTNEEHELVLLLDEKRRDEYISKRLKELDNYSDEKLISSLSEAKQSEYIERRTAELQTRRRQEIERPVGLKGTGRSVAVAASPSREETEKTKNKKKKSKND